MISQPGQDLPALPKRFFGQRSIPKPSLRQEGSVQDRLSARSDRTPTCAADTPVKIGGVLGDETRFFVPADGTPIGSPMRNSLSYLRGMMTPQSAGDICGFYESLAPLSPPHLIQRGERISIQDLPGDEPELQPVSLKMALVPEVGKKGRTVTETSLPSEWFATVEELPQSPTVLAKRSDGRWRCTFFVGIPETRDWGVVKRIIGVKGYNMKTIIAQVPGTKIRLRGQGSGFLDQLTGIESSDPLQINLNAPTFDVYVKAQALVVDLLEYVYAEYEAYSGIRVSTHRLGNSKNGRYN